MLIYTQWFGPRFVIIILTRMANVISHWWKSRFPFELGIETLGNLYSEMMIRALFMEVFLWNRVGVSSNHQPENKLIIVFAVQFCMSRFGSYCADFRRKTRRCIGNANSSNWVMQVFSRQPVWNSSCIRAKFSISSRNGDCQNIVSFRRFVLRPPASFVLCRLRNYVTHCDYSMREFSLQSQPVVAGII